MPAFAAAVALGYRYVETDVHATADGVLVAFHDHRLDRLTDRVGAIGEQPWSEVRRALVGGVEPIVRLDDLLGTWPDLRVNIDAKQDAAVAPLAIAVERAAAVERVCVAAFSDRRIAQVRRLVGPRLCTALGPGAIARLRANSFGVPVGRLRAGAVQVPLCWRGASLVDRRLVAAAHRQGLQVHVWTIDRPDEMTRLLDLGVDGIMTDRPAVLAEVLAQRGLWPA